MDLSRKSTKAGLAVGGSASTGAPLEAEALQFLRRKATVGSHGTAVDYAKDERVFHSKDMPGRARDARLQVKQSMADAVNKRVWNTSVQVPCVLDKRTMRNFEFDPSEYDYNFRAEELPESRPVVKDVFGRTTSLVLDATKVWQHTEFVLLVSKPQEDRICRMAISSVRKNSPHIKHC
jgi:hypothetical protein